MSLIPPPEDSPYPELYWMAMASVIFGFFMAFGIGANDVGNCFATTVAAKSLTLAQAVVVAGIFEFLGALLLGASVTKTIRSGILDMEVYADKQDVLAFGMLVALVNASFWLILATVYGLPVSATHTVVAAIIGFSIAVEGFSSVMWMACGRIFISWIAAPALTGVVGFLMFWSVKRGVLESEKPFDRALASYSIVLFVTLFIGLFFVLAKGATNMEMSTGYKALIAFGASAVIAIVFQLFLVRLMKKRIIQLEEQQEEAVAAKSLKDTERTEVSPSDEASVELDVDATVKTTKLRAFLTLLADKTYNRDLEAEARAMDDDAAEINDDAVVYDAKSEILYSYLQVFTSCVLSFAHGSNDVANAIAPICAILAIYETGALTTNAGVPKWVLVMGAFGMVIGLALLGYKIIISIGYRLTKISPSRGFAIQLSTSFVVLVASYLGIPVSTTQSTIGATIGVGIVNGKGGVQWMYILNVFLGWVGSFFITCLTSAGIMAFCYYSPSAPAYSEFIVANITANATGIVDVEF